MQRQKLKIDFDLKAHETVSFTYKAGEIDRNGVEVELSNIDLTGAYGVVNILFVDTGEKHTNLITIVDGKGTFIVPTASAGNYEFEVEIINSNGLTISANYLYTVLPSIGETSGGTPEEETTILMQIVSLMQQFSEQETQRETNEDERVVIDADRTKRFEAMLAEYNATVDRFNDAILGGSIPEVGDARGDFPLLGDRLDDADAKILANTNLANSKLGKTENAVSASKLNTPRNINGGSFDGTADLLTPKWGVTRNVTIGNTTKGLDGSGNVSWSLSEIGVSKNDLGLGNVDNTADSAKNVLSATKLTTARKISLDGSVKGSVNFDGSDNISILNTLKETTLTSNFFNDFRGEIQGSSGLGSFISNIRADTTIDDYAIAYASGLAFGMKDTHGYLNINYNSPQVYIGGGSNNKLTWVKSLAFIDSSITGNASTANKLQTPRQIALTGDVTGSVNFDGSGNVSIATTVVNAPSGDFLPLTGGTLTGNVTAPTFIGSLNGNASTASKLRYSNEVQIWCGSTILTTTGGSFRHTLCTSAQLNSWVGGSGQANIIIEVTNGDYNAHAKDLDGTANKGTDWLVSTSSSSGFLGGALRVNFRITRWS